MKILILVLLFLTWGLLPVFAQSAAKSSSHSPFTLGVAARASTLGFGADVAAPVTHRTNVRVGFNFFDFNRTFHKDEIAYKGALQLRSVQTLFDVFPFGGNFHLSPGLLIYNGNQVNATASEPVSHTFSLGSASYTTTGVLTGKAKLEMNKVAPMFLVGFGNLVPRSHRHVVFSLEGGFAYQGSPKVTLNLAGNACTSGICGDLATLPIAQTDIAAEVKKLNHDVSPFQFYPIVSFGFGYKF